MCHWSEVGIGELVAQIAKSQLSSEVGGIATLKAQHLKPSSGEIQHRILQPVH